MCDNGCNWNPRDVFVYGMHINHVVCEVTYCHFLFISFLYFSVSDINTNFWRLIELLLNPNGWTVFMR